MYLKKLAPVVMLVTFLQIITAASIYADSSTEAETISDSTSATYTEESERKFRLSQKIKEARDVLVEDRETELGFMYPESKHLFRTVQDTETVKYLQLIYDRILIFRWEGKTTTPDFFVDPNNENCYFISPGEKYIYICAWYDSVLKKLSIYEKRAPDIYKVPYYENLKMKEDDLSYQDIQDIAWYYLGRESGKPTIYSYARGGVQAVDANWWDLNESPSDTFIIYFSTYPENQPWEGTAGLPMSNYMYLFNSSEMNIYQIEMVLDDVPDKFICDVDMQEVKTAVENHNKTYLTEEQLLDIAKKYIKAMPNSTAHVETDWVNYNCAFIIMTPTGSEEEIANTELPLSQRRVYWWNGDTRELYESDPVAPCPDKKAVKFVAKVHGYVPPDERPLKSWEK